MAPRRTIQLAAAALLAAPARAAFFPPAAAALAAALVLVSPSRASLVVSTVPIPMTNPRNYFGWNANIASPAGGQSNLDGPRYIQLVGNTMYLFTSFQASATGVPASQMGAQLMRIEVDGGVATGPLVNVVGGNPTPPCNIGIINGAGHAAMFPSVRNPFVVDPAREIVYVVDYSNHGLRSVSLAAADYGTSTTLGGGMYCYTGIGSSCVCSAGGTCYAGCAGAGGGFSDGTLAMATLASGMTEFYYIETIAQNPSTPTHLYVSDFGCRIRRVDLTAHTVTTIAGGGAVYGPPSYPSPVAGYAGAKSLRARLCKAPNCTR